MSIKQLPRQRLSQSEQGMISIMTTMVLIIVISLIVLGFAQLSRSNQREALDRQLSTQAFYAAESGVNDARSLINTAVANGSTIPEKSTCTGNGGGFYTTTPTIDSAANVKYSCLLVDPTPTTLRYTDVGTNSVIVPLNSSNGTNFSRIELDWQSKVSGNPLTGCSASMNAYTAASAWTCGYGVLRFDLVPTSGNSLSASTLLAGTMTSFAYPVTAATSADVPYVAGASNPNVRVAKNCTATGCSLNITGLSTTSYYMRISSIYRNVSLQIKGLDSGGGAIEMAGAQAQIDSTGRAQDVLRRIQVSVPLASNSQNQMSDYAIQSTDSVCKRFSIMDNYFSNDVSGVTSTNRLCQP